MAWSFTDIGKMLYLDIFIQEIILKRCFILGKTEGRNFAFESYTKILMFINNLENISNDLSHFTLRLSK